MNVFMADGAQVDERARVGEGGQVWHLAQIRERAELGERCVVGRGAYVGPDVRIGARVKIQNHALVYEPASLADGVFVGPAVVLTNDQHPRAVTPDGEPKTAHDWDPVGVTVHEGASLGARSVCVAPVTIGAWAMVAAGAVVTRDVPAYALVAGVPAKRIGWVGRAGVRLVRDPDGAPDEAWGDEVGGDEVGGDETRWVCPRTGERFHEADGALAPQGNARAEREER